MKKQLHIVVRGENKDGKRERIITTYDGKEYEAVGFFCDDVIFVPTDSKDTRCLVYCPAEIEELFEKGIFRKVAK